MDSQTALFVCMYTMHCMNTVSQNLILRILIKLCCMCTGWIHYWTGEHKLPLHTWD